MNQRMIGLGCMRLSTEPEQRDPEHGIAVIHAALDSGVRLLDTADVYCLDDSDIGHNERLIARALASWPGDRTSVTIATKGGLRRPGGQWVPDGRASNLRAACDASRRTLGVDVIDLYQLHAVDPRTAFETSVRALAGLQGEGKIRRVGLSNVTVSQIEAARKIVGIAAVQVSLSTLEDENFRNGVAEYCREHGIQLIAYRPLGGARSIARVARDETLNAIATRHAATPHEIAIAWLLDLDEQVVPIPGARRVETARSIGGALQVQLTENDRQQLDARFPQGRLLRTPRTQRRPPPDAKGEVVLIMGMPGAGKSTAAQAFVQDGYIRLNRDQQGGSLSDLVSAMDSAMANGQRQFVLDNTYASRAARNDLIEVAWRHGVPARCIWLTTSSADAQINAITRMINVHGRLPTPEEIRERGKTDPRFFGPDAQFRYERQLEPPHANEGFAAIEELPFARQQPARAHRALILEYDGVVTPERRASLQEYQRQGWKLLALAWRPEITDRRTTHEDLRKEFDDAREKLNLDIHIAYCPHPAGPPICWCRKPLPGLVLEFAAREDVDLSRSILVGRAPADRTLADKLSVEYQDHSAFFAV